MTPEETVLNLGALFSGFAVMWRMIVYQGNEIAKLTKRLDQLWDKCAGENVDADNKIE